MNQSENLLDPQLEPYFSSLRGEISRAPQAYRRGRSNFLAQARTMHLPVSKLDQRRLTKWKATLSKYLIHKEYSPMYATIASFILVLALMFGGTGATVLAAQDSLPNQYLYQFKTFAEDLALQSALRNTNRLQMELEYAERRVNEMTQMRIRDLDVPETAYLRLEKHLNQALQIAAHTEESEMIRTLNQVRERLQTQIASLSPELDQDPQLIRTRDMIQSRLSWVEFGLDQPLKFQEQAQVRTRFDAEPQFDQGYGPGPEYGTQPAEQGFGPGPQETEPKNEQCPSESCEPDPEHSFGPGPKAEEGQNQISPGPNQPAQGDDSPGSDQSPSGSNGPGPGPGSNQDSESGNGVQGSDANGSTQGTGSNTGNGGKP